MERPHIPDVSRDPAESGAESAGSGAEPAGSGAEPAESGSYASNSEPDAQESRSGPRGSADGLRSGGSGPLRLHEAARTALRQIALDAIERGLSRGGPLPVKPGSYPPPLDEPGAVFVTLKSGGRLRGCIGSTVARRPLAEDVASNAYAAAFQDPRFRPLRPEELQSLEIHISLLTPQVPIEAKTREELLTSLRPGIDGLLLEDPPHRSTFLPQVWEALPQPSAFLEELFLKAGLPRNHWSGSLRFFRYTVEEI